MAFGVALRDANVRVRVQRVDEVFGRADVQFVHGRVWKRRDSLWGFVQCFAACEDGAQQVLIDPRRVRPRAATRERAGDADDAAPESRERTPVRAPGARSRRGAEDRDVGVHGDSDGLLDARGPWFSRRVHVVRRPEQEHRGEGTGVGERGAVRVSERLERLEDGGGLRPEYLPRLSLVSRDACRVESVLGGEACQRLEARVLEEAGCGVVADERHVTVRHVAGRQTAETLGEDGSRQVRETHLGRRTPPKETHRGDRGSRGCPRTCPLARRR